MCCRISHDLSPLIIPDRGLCLFLDSSRGGELPTSLHCSHVHWVLGTTVQRSCGQASRPTWPGALGTLLPAWAVRRLLQLMPAAQCPVVSPWVRYYIKALWGITRGLFPAAHLSQEAFSGGERCTVFENLMGVSDSRKMHVSTFTSTVENQQTSQGSPRLNSAFHTDPPQRGI